MHKSQSYESLEQKLNVNNSPIITSKKLKITMDLNVLFKFIKPYNGNRETLNSFLIDCNNVIELATEAQRPIIVKYILSQLEGRAQLACSIKEFDKWDQLKDFLKTQFGERKHYSHLLTELQESRQGSLTVGQFALKIETCLSQLLTEISISNHKAIEVPGRTAAMEDLALHHFMMGLKPQISMIVRCKSPSTLNEAINIAVCEERIQQNISSRSQTSTPFIDGKPGKNHAQPYKKPFAGNTQTPYVKPFNRAQLIVCRYCKSPGHSIDNCRKREFNNNRFRNNDLSLQNRDIKPRINFVETNDANDDDYGHDEVDYNHSKNS